LKELTDRALLILLASVTALGPVSTNLYLPALPAVRADFGASVAEVQATFAVALTMFAIGILAWGPFSDRFGRRPAILSGLVILLFGATICLFGHSLSALIVGRGIMALGTSSGLVVARAIVSDRYPADRMVKMLAYLTMVAVVGNSLAPLVGGYIAAGFGWRGIFALLMAAAVVVGILVSRRLPETRRVHGKSVAGRDMLATVGNLLRMPIFAGCVVQSGIIYATFLVFISLAPYLMVSALGRGPTEFGLYYLYIAVGYFLGNWSVTRFMASHDLHWMVVTGVVLAVIGAVAALGFAALGLMHPLWIFIPLGVLSFGQGLALPNITATAVSLAPQHAGVASSLIGFMQQIIGAICVQAMGVFPTDTPYPVLIFCAAVCLFAFAMLWVFPRVEVARPATRARAANSPTSS
jgi:DHA1 family bicyclomycin/chloramphenicol resistance-like MFS transporter